MRSGATAWRSDGGWCSGDIGRGRGRADRLADGHAGADASASVVGRADGDRETVARARAELGYVDFLRGRYDRAKHWLTQALEFADDEIKIAAKATTYLGCVNSDRANYPRALALLGQAVQLAQEANDPRREAYANSMIGRIHLLRQDLDGRRRSAGCCHRAG